MGAGGGGFSAQEAIDAETCALRWFYFDSGLIDNASCDVVFAGHSRGGLVAHNMLDIVGVDPYLSQLTVRAMLLLASSRIDGSVVLPEYEPNRAVPLLAFGTSSDEQVPGQVLEGYDRMAVENQHTPPQAVGSPYRGALWIYDLPHTGFGGLTMPSTKGSAITNAYVDRFVRWQVFGDETLRPFFVGEAFPPEVLEPGFWNNLPAYDQISDPALCGDASNQTEPACVAAGCAWDGSACQQRPVILSSFTIDNRLDSDQRQLADLFEFPQVSSASTPGHIVDVTIGEVGVVAGGEGLAANHDTGVAFVETVDGSGVPDGIAHFSAATADASLAAHTSLRIGARSRIVSDLVADPQVCESLYGDPLDVAIVLGDGIDSTEPVDLDPIVQQDARIVQTLSTGNACLPQLFMHTQRIPMTEVCDGAFVDTENISEWSFVVPGAVDFRDEFVVDTLEFTTSQADVTAVGTCPTTTALWECVADPGVLPERSVCTAEPIGGACPMGATQTEFLSLPTVPAEWGGPFDGWVVHMPPGFSNDPFNPTPELQAAMEQRCQLACERQWMHDPAVSIDCTQSGAFTSVAPISTPSQGPLRRIRPDRRDGSGFFSGQALGCNLEDDCCFAFDEDMCASMAMRTTPAATRVGLAAEYLFDIDSSSSTLTAQANGTIDSVQLYGTIGFSECAETHPAGPCPFALTSLDAKSIGSIKVPVTCPNGNVIHRTLYYLDVSLRQPAFGIAEDGTDQVGFPAGSLILDASFKLNQMDYAVGGPSQIDLEVTASPTAFEALQIPVHGEMPACWGQNDIPAIGEFDLVLDLASGAVESPPAITIDIPSSVSCPSVVTLEASTSDPDADLASVRWTIDGVPMESSVSSITMTEPHTFEARAMDSRGAVTSAAKAVGCQ
jgi:hypothetical protein